MTTKIAPPEPLTETATALACFDPITADLQKLAKENALTQFDYEDATGNRLARSWIYKLRLIKGRTDEAHKIAKAKALEVCQVLDAKKRDIIRQVDDMIQVHAKPIQEIENREARLAEEKRLADEKIKADAEAARLAEIKRQEDAAALKAKELKDREDELNRREREAQIAEDARVKAEQRAEQDRKDADRRHREALAFEQQRTAALLQAAADKARREREAAEFAARQKQESEAIAQREASAKEAARVSNQKHRAQIERHIYDDLALAIGEDKAEHVLDSLRENRIRHVSIQY